MPNVPRLGSVLESDEPVEDAQQTRLQDDNHSLDSPDDVSRQKKKRGSVKTPKTEPRVARTEMHPKSAHVSTLPPNSGTKLGFTDIPSEPRRSLESIQNTPSRSSQKSSAKPQSFNFTFASDTVLSDEAQKMMDTVRDEAARIKAQMKAQKDLQDQRDGEAEKMFNPSGRKMAQPKPKVGRFSDVHMAQFKRMDSIANHASSFRARPGYTQPTATSLKRSPSKAGLDELERPRTAGKGTPGRIPVPQFGARSAAVSPFKSVPTTTTDHLENASPAKRARRSESDDVSATRVEDQRNMKSSAIPKSSSSLFSPTKASLARTSQSASPAKASRLPHSRNARSVRDAARKSLGRTTAAVSKFTSRLLEAQQESRLATPALSRSASASNLSEAVQHMRTPTVATTAVPTSFSSKLPTFLGLKSILRSPRKENNTPADRQGTPKRPNTSAGIPESTKKVDFTPSVKSRYAVKLANNSPSPAKAGHVDMSERSKAAPVLYDPAAYVVDHLNDDEWEDTSSSPVEYPTLPTLSKEPPPRAGPVVQTVAEKEKGATGRHSKDFKSIFTTLHPRPNTAGMRSGPHPLPAIPAGQISQSPRDTTDKSSRASTIRRVRSSGSNEMVQPFEDTEVNTMAHGLPAKKRRRESMYFDSHESAEGIGKENRPVPGAWNEEEDVDDESSKRAKRAKTFDFKDVEVEPVGQLISPKKKSAAREAAARSARDRKSMMPGQAKTTPGKGVLSMSRLQMLSQPKRRT